MAASVCHRQEALDLWLHRFESFAATLSALGEHQQAEKWRAWVAARRHGSK